MAANTCIDKPARAKNVTREAAKQGRRYNVCIKPVENMHSKKHQATKHTPGVYVTIEPRVRMAKPILGGLSLQSFSLAL